MKKSWVLFCVFIIHDSCIDKLSITTPNTSLQLVVDGAITDAPGPYTVRLSWTRKLEDYLSPKLSVAAKAVTIFDNEGNFETLTEVSDGTFKTSKTGMRGVIGKEYFVRIELNNGKVYESIPERINPAGAVDSIYYEFQTKVSELDISNYQFRFFMNSQGEKEGENYFLWKMTGTYRVITSPELYFVRGLGPAPRACSGFVFDVKANKLVSVRPCECCQCWVDLVGNKPNVSDNYIVANRKFNQVEVGVIPVEFWPFWDKTLVKIEQLSLSQAAFNYWKTIQDQKEGATSLFQPSIGKALSNISLKNGNEEVQGFFYAAGVVKKTLFLSTKDIPLGAGVIPPPPGLGPGRQDTINTFIIRESCLNAFKHSTTQQPPDWK
ncbi:MAG: DUF4249 domain-containing protein [Cyclobacteriaceae bacterium]